MKNDVFRYFSRRFSFCANRLRDLNMRCFYLLIYLLSTNFTFVASFSVYRKSRKQLNLLRRCDSFIFIIIIFDGRKLLLRLNLSQWIQERGLIWLNAEVKIFFRLFMKMYFALVAVGHRHSAQSTRQRLAWSSTLNTNILSKGNLIFLCLEVKGSDRKDVIFGFLRFYGSSNRSDSFDRIASNRLGRKMIRCARQSPPKMGLDLFAISQWGSETRLWRGIISAVLQNCVQVNFASFFFRRFRCFLFILIHMGCSRISW